MTMPEQTPWAAKAAALYDAGYADRYRSHDDSLADSGPYLGFVAWLQRVCARFTSPAAALELGCGTGRYFSALQNVQSLVASTLRRPCSRSRRIRFAKMPSRWSASRWWKAMRWRTSFRPAPST